jgi:molybdopterin synthase catalytic subunit
MRATAARTVADDAPPGFDALREWRLARAKADEVPAYVVFSNATLEEIAARQHGAVVTFVGRARDHADDGRPVVELEYEAYPEMAAGVLDEIAADAERRFGCAVAVIHRVGVVPIGEAAVAIVTAAAHRGAAYEANRFVIEAIKERLPIWKRERFADGSEWKRPGA